MNREEFTEKANAILGEVNAKIKDLEAKKEAAERDLESYDDALDDLESRKEDLMERLNRLDDMDDDEWEDVREWFASASDRFREGLSKIAGLFS